MLWLQIIDRRVNVSVRVMGRLQVLNSFPLLHPIRFLLLALFSREIPCRQKCEHEHAGEAAFAATIFCKAFLHITNTAEFGFALADQAGDVTFDP